MRHFCGASEQVHVPESAELSAKRDVLPRSRGHSEDRPVGVRSPWQRLAGGEIERGQEVAQLPADAGEETPDVCAVACEGDRAHRPRRAGVPRRGCTGRRIEGGDEAARLSADVVEVPAHVDGRSAHLDVEHLIVGFGRP